MPQYVPLRFEPGVWKNGTLYQAQGRWFAADLMRWSVGALGPIGGWRTWGTGTTAITNVPRSSLPWMDNTFRRWIAVGTYANLYVYDHAASLFNITPVGFTEGREDADPNIGYGNGVYGFSSYGDSRPDLGIPEPATICPSTCGARISSAAPPMMAMSISGTRAVQRLHLL